MCVFTILTWKHSQGKNTLYVYIFLCCIGFIVCLGIFIDYSLQRLQGTCVNYDICDKDWDGHSRNGPQCVKYQQTINGTITTLSITDGSYFPQTMSQSCWASDTEVTFYDPQNIIIYGGVVSCLVPLILICCIKHWFCRINKNKKDSVMKNCFAMV
jgi:hypothetical protein